MKIENDTSDCAVLFLRSFRVQNWCKFGAKTYRTMQKLYNDMRRKRHKIAQNERFSTIFRGINASRKTPRDNLCGILCGANNSCRTPRIAKQFSKVQIYFDIQKALLRRGFLLFVGAFIERPWATTGRPYGTGRFNL